VIKEGNKVGSSEAALLAKLNVKPFSYGLNIKYVYEGGVFPTDVLKISEAVLLGLMAKGIGECNAVALGVGYLTEGSLPHVIGQGVKNILAIALETGYLEFKRAVEIQEILDTAEK